MDVRIAAPEDLWPSSDVQTIAEELAASSGARIHIGDEVLAGVEGADFLYTDVWVSMGEPASDWETAHQAAAPLPGQRRDHGGDRQSRRQVHALPPGPAQHRHRARSPDLPTSGTSSALEVTDEVFESPASIVFDQAENRLHTIKAAMVASLGD